MGKTLILNAEIREHTGSKPANMLRKNQKLPAIIYGHKKQPLAITIDVKNFIETMHHGYRLINVKVGKNTEKIIIKALQYNHLGKEIIHVDLMRVDVTETVKVTVPIELKGTAKGILEGAILEEHTDHLEIECRASDIPDFIIVSIKELGVGDTLHAGDIELPEGLKLVSSPETLLVSCHLVAVAKTTEEVEAEVPVAPEVIGEVKEEQEPAEEEQA